MSLSKAVAYINPLFFYYAVLYTLSKCLQWISGADESIWQRIWDKVIDIVGEDEKFFSVWVVNTYAYGIYWTFGLILLYLETTRPEILEKYRIQEKKSSANDVRNVFKVVKVVLFNQLVGYVAIYLLFTNGLPPHFRVSRELPSFPKVMFDLIICMLGQEIFFYYSHRMLHHKIFYKLIHKKHHELITPYGITAIYCNTFEHIISNLLPVVVGLVILDCHVATALLWFTIVIVTTINDHSGYHLPFLHSSELHDYHHLTFNSNYSVYGFMDLLHNTYGSFRNAVSYEHHKTLFGFHPIYREHDSSPHSDSIKSEQSN